MEGLALVLFQHRLYYQILDLCRGADKNRQMRGQRSHGQTGVSAPIRQNRHLHAGLGRKIGNRTAVEYVGVEGERGAVAKPRVEDIRGVLLAPVYVHLCVVDPVRDLRTPRFPANEPVI